MGVVHEVLVSLGGRLVKEETRSDPCDSGKRGFGVFYTFHGTDHTQRSGPKRVGNHHRPPDTWVEIDLESR